LVPAHMAHGGSSAACVCAVGCDGVQRGRSRGGSQRQGSHGAGQNSSCRPPAGALFAIKGAASASYGDPFVRAARAAGEAGWLLAGYPGHLRRLNRFATGRLASVTNRRHGLRQAAASSSRAKAAQASQLDAADGVSASRSSAASRGAADASISIDDSDDDAQLVPGAGRGRGGSAAAARGGGRGGAAAGRGAAAAKGKTRQIPLSFGSESSASAGASAGAKAARKSARGGGGGGGGGGKRSLFFPPECAPPSMICCGQLMTPICRGTLTNSSPSHVCRKSRDFGRGRRRRRL
jgi:hypothetical protein